MNVKRYFSPSMQESLRLIREELGPDAVILSSSKTNNGVEIFATNEYEEEPPIIVEEPCRLKNISDQNKLGTPQAKESSKKVSSSAEANSHILVEEAQKDASGKKYSEVLSLMREEILELRELIIAPRKQAKPQEKGAGIDIKLRNRLLGIGLQLPVIDNILSRIGDEVEFERAWAKAIKHMQLATVTEHSDILELGGVVSLVGPPGSGKTTTIEKLAVRYVEKYGASNLALVKVDSSAVIDRPRVATHEALTALGKSLDVPVFTVDANNSLDSVLNECSDRKCVLVDTAGLVGDGALWREQSRQLRAVGTPIRHYLVTPSTAQYAVMMSNYAHFKELGLAGSILTKLDEAVSLGEAVSYLIESRLPCVYFTNGQRVPEDICLADKVRLVNRADSLFQETSLEGKSLRGSSLQGNPLQDESNALGLNEDGGQSQLIRRVLSDAV